MTIPVAPTARMLQWQKQLTDSERPLAPAVLVIHPPGGAVTQLQPIGFPGGFPVEGKGVPFEAGVAALHDVADEGPSEFFVHTLNKDAWLSECKESAWVL